MAHIATLKILVDESNESAVYDGINEILRDAQYGGPNGEDRGWVVDWKFDSVDSTNRSVNKSIANGTYKEGNAFADWVIFSASEARDNDGAGFWSNKYGWTTMDAATKFDACFTALPISSGNDAVWMLAPYRMTFYRIMLVESPDDDTLDQTPIAYECFAENYEHAVDQAEDAYPGCKVLGMDI